MYHNVTINSATWFQRRQNPLLARSNLDCLIHTKIKPDLTIPAKFGFQDDGGIVKNLHRRKTPNDGQQAKTAQLGKSGTHKLV